MVMLLSLFQSLYSSLCLWILTLVMTIVYQNNMAWRPFPSFMDTAAWVLGYHILLLVFLPLQVRLGSPGLWSPKESVDGFPGVHARGRVIIIKYIQIPCIS